MEFPPSHQRRTRGVEPFLLDDRLAMFSSMGAAVWNTSSGEEVNTVAGGPGRTEGLAVAPGGDMVVTCGDAGAIAWDVGSGEKLHAFEIPGPPPSAQCAAARRHLHRPSCLVAVALGPVLDPQGIGRGVSWRDLPRVERRSLL